MDLMLMRKKIEKVIIPSISIVIPTLNEGKNIKRCLDSIYKQKYKGKLEVFIVDGGSKDRTLEIARKYPTIILKNPYIVAEAGKKIGLNKSTGTYFMILDCDMDIVGKNWFQKMIYPLETDKTIVGSWTKFVSFKSDSSLDKYITLDPIQRDPLFKFLTPTIGSCVVERNRKFTVVEYNSNRILPSGFCVYRRKQILKTKIKDRQKFMELDNLVILTNEVSNRFAYVDSLGIHHPFLNTMGKLIRKRKRNIDVMYFGQLDPRVWTWIDWNNPLHIIKIFLWVIYSCLFFPSLIVGIIKCVRYKTVLGFYEPVFNFVTTTHIIVKFLQNKEGRLLVKRAMGNLFKNP